MNFCLLCRDTIHFNIKITDIQFSDEKPKLIRKNKINKLNSPIQTNRTMKIYSTEAEVSTKKTNK